jgi:hypothetical protein
MIAFTCVSLHSRVGSSWSVPQAGKRPRTAGLDLRLRARPIAMHITRTDLDARYCYLVPDLDVIPRPGFGFVLPSLLVLLCTLPGSSTLDLGQQRELFFHWQSRIGVDFTMPRKLIFACIQPLGSSSCFFSALFSACINDCLNSGRLP